MKTVRFWEYINGDFVKLSLKDGETLRYHWFEYQEEGWSGGEEVYYREGDFVHCQQDSSGVDCDGRLDRSGDFRANIYATKMMPIYNGWYDDQPPTPIENLGRRLQWEQVSSSQRDHFAEAAGY